MRSTTALPLFTTFASATFYGGGIVGQDHYIGGAYGPQYPNTENFDIAAFQDGNAHPNSTHSVTFGNFTWRTNVSQIAVNDATTQPPGETAISDAHIVTTVFDLTWPQRGNRTNTTIGDALQSAGVVAPYGCYILLDGLNIPVNATSRYQESDGSNCTSVLGADCIRDYLAAIGGTPSGAACPNPPRPPPSCAGTLGVGGNIYYAFTESLEIPEYNQTALQSGQGFAHILSSVSSGANATALQLAESRLQILAIPGLNTMVCQKVNSTIARPTVTAGASPAATTTNAASVVRGPEWTMLGLGMLGAVVMGL